MSTPPLPPVSDPEQTLSLSQCPLCGFQPIPDGAVKCPKCEKTFTFALRHLRAEIRQGSVAVVGVPARQTGQRVRPELGPQAAPDAMSRAPFIPGPTAVLLLAGAVIWFFRVFGVGLWAGEPAWVYAIAAFDLALVPVVLLNMPNAKLAAAAAFGVQLGLSVALAGKTFFHLSPALFQLHAAMGLVATVGFPTAVRRRAAMVVGFFGAVFAGGALPGYVAGGARSELVSAELGFRLSLPHGYSRQVLENLSTRISVPSGLGASSVAFGGRDAVGVITVLREKNVQLIGGCQAYLAALGATDAPRPIPDGAPRVLGDRALVYEVRSVSGVGRLACAKVEGDRFVALAVMSRGKPSEARAAFEDVGRGLTIK